MNRFLELIVGQYPGVAGTFSSHLLRLKQKSLSFRPSAMFTLRLRHSILMVVARVITLEYGAEFHAVAKMSQACTVAIFITQIAERLPVRALEGWNWVPLQRECALNQGAMRCRLAQPSCCAHCVLWSQGAGAGCRCQCPVQGGCCAEC